MEHAFNFDSRKNNRHINPDSFIPAYPNIRSKVIETSGPSMENILEREQKGLADGRNYPFASRAYGNVNEFEDITYDPKRQPDTKHSRFWRPSVPVIPAQNNLIQQPLINTGGPGNVWFYSYDFVDQPVEFSSTGVIPEVSKQAQKRKSEGYRNSIKRTSKRNINLAIDNYILQRRDNIPPLSGLSGKQPQNKLQLQQKNKLLMQNALKRLSTAHKGMK